MADVQRQKAFGNQTPEEKCANLAKAKIARAKRRADGAVRYKRDYYQNTIWESAARKLGVRLPEFSEAPTEVGCKRWLRRLNVPLSSYSLWMGEGGLPEFVRMNPAFGLRYIVGMWCWELVETGSIV